ncbi:double-stranded RNA-binding protein 7-like [Typha angustifolia]|uniref:double-stranded RNA-binding protein 7-like n=1 Tax=Typha angustifolia TaxID=59011 RepID=UPI003C2F1894
MAQNPIVQPTNSALLSYEHSSDGNAAALQHSSATTSPGVANCYVFKSRLQEYAQKVGLPTPEYHTVKEGPSHEPVFKSTVIVNNVRYDSLPGFYNRKAAEQSAAEIALMEIHRSGQMVECIPTVHETGLCKNLLQEYAQKMNYAIPSYVCNKQPSGSTPFTCTVEIGGIQYIGAAARTKKEAEIKAARTALLAIQSQSEMGANGTSQYTVVPGQKKGKESEVQIESVKQLKPKKANLKKRWNKRRLPRKNKDEQIAKSEKDESGTLKVEDASEIAQSDGVIFETTKEYSEVQCEGPVENQNQHSIINPVLGANGSYNGIEF